MAINQINGMYPSSVRGSGRTEQTASAKLEHLSAGSLSGKPVSEVEQVQLTPGSLSLRQLETDVQKPPVDEAKVAALRKAIASGDYQPNSGQIARKMIDFEEALFS